MTNLDQIAELRAELNNGILTRRGRGADPGRAQGCPRPPSPNRGAPSRYARGAAAHMGRRSFRTQLADTSLVDHGAVVLTPSSRRYALATLPVWPAPATASQCRATDQETSRSSRCCTASMIQSLKLSRRCTAATLT